ncbi:DUF892 family protein [Pedobacter aquatilis]|uniref:DUF892 family protein n=1 Tax=Pedobacter aquatilis TaxID=351343 RepID=UPI00292E2889|nr:DUF892 family protein [Pedobacter aquatilis]
MTTETNTPNSWDRINLGSDQLTSFFIRHLDRIYAAKLHLVEKLPALGEEAQFGELKNAIAETVSDVERQLTRIQLIYTLLDRSVERASIFGVSGLIEDAYDGIARQRGDQKLQDLSIIFYLQNIESMEMASFQMLLMAAAQIGHPHVNKLLKENYDEAKSDRTLLLLLTSKYIVN